MTSANVNKREDGYDAVARTFGQLSQVSSFDEVVRFEKDLAES